jgi:hypothetical protein
MIDRRDEPPPPLDYAPPAPRRTPVYRLALSAFLIVAGVGALLLAGMVDGPAAANVFVTGLGLLICGLVVRSRRPRA